MLETCRRLRKLRRKHSNNVARHYNTPVKSTLLSRDMKVLIISNMYFISAKPKILKKNEYSSIDVGQTLVESCRTEGHPTPFVFWERKVDASYKIISNSTRGNR